MPVQGKMPRSNLTGRGGGGMSLDAFTRLTCPLHLHQPASEVLLSPHLKQNMTPHVHLNKRLATNFWKAFKLMNSPNVVAASVLFNHNVTSRTALPLILDHGRLEHLISKMVRTHLEAASVYSRAASTSGTCLPSTLGTFDEATCVLVDLKEPCQHPYNVRQLCLDRDVRTLMKALQSMLEHHNFRSASCSLTTTLYCLTRSLLSLPL